MLNAIDFIFQIPFQHLLQIEKKILVKISQEGYEYLKTSD